MELAEKYIPGWITLSQNKKPDLLNGFKDLLPRDIHILDFLKIAKEQGTPLEKVEFGEWSRIDMYINRERNICFVFLKSTSDTRDMDIDYTLIDVSECPIINKSKNCIGYAASDN